MIPKKVRIFLLIGISFITVFFPLFEGFYYVLVGISSFSSTKIMQCLYKFKWKQIPWWHTNPDDVWIYFYVSILQISHRFSFHLIFFCFFLCYHYTWISPRMLYIQYVDMHLCSSFADLDSSYFNAASLSSCWISGELLLIILYSYHHYKPASKMATVPMKVTWKVSVNIALSLALILAELNPERKLSPEIPNSQKQPENHRYNFFFFTVFMYEITDVSELQRWTTARSHQTNSWEWLRAARLTCAALQPRGRCAAPASVVSAGVIGVTAAAMQGKPEDCFCAPQRKKKRKA